MIIIIIIILDGSNLLWLESRLTCTLYKAQINFSGLKWQVNILKVENMPNNKIMKDTTKT